MLIVGWGGSSVGKCLANMQEALGPIPSMAKKPHAPLPPKKRHNKTKQKTNSLLHFFVFVQSARN